MKKLLIIFILPLVLLIGAGAGAFFYGLIPGLGPAGSQQSEEEMKGTLLFHSSKLGFNLLAAVIVI